MLRGVKALGFQVRKHIGLMLGGIALAHTGNGLRDGSHAALGSTFDEGETLLRQSFGGLLLHDCNLGKFTSERRLEDPDEGEKG